MRRALAVQAAALALHLDARRRGVPIPVLASDSTTPAVGGFSRIEFVVRRRIPVLGVARRAIVAANPGDWMKYVLAGGVEDISLRYTAEGAILSDDYGNGEAYSDSSVNWVIKVRERGGESLWKQTWRVLKKRRSGGGAVSVAYEATDGNELALRPVKTMAEAEEALTQALAEAGEFASRHFHGNFSERFAAIKRYLQHGEAEPGLFARPYYRDGAVPPADADVKAERLASASIHAWVFGGMCSWNDYEYDEEELNIGHEKQSRKLYRAMLDGLCAAVGGK